jgi:hypothetical protein
MVFVDLFGVNLPGKLSEARIACSTIVIPLPGPPHPQNQKFTTAKEVLRKLSEFLSVWRSS